MDLTSRSSKAKTSSEDSQTYLQYQLSDDSFVTVSMPYKSIDLESEQVSLRVVTDPAPPVVAHRITSQEDEIGSVLLLVVATSRSMIDFQEDLVEESGGSFATRGEVVLDAIDSLIDECRDEEDVLGLVTFASRSEVVFPLESANKDKKKEWKRKLRENIAFGGRENLEKGIIDAVSQLKDLDKERYASASIMIISDGFINAGKGFVNSMNDDKIKAAQKELVDFTKESLQGIQGLKVRVSVCGIGDDFDRGMLREMCNTGAARGLPYSLAQPSTLLEKMKTALSKTLELERTQPAGRRKKKTVVANEMKIRIELNQGASLSIVKLRRLLRKGNKTSEGMKKISLDPFDDGDQSITFSPLPEKAMIDIPVLLGPADGLGKHDYEGQNIMPRLPNTKNMYRIATIYALWLKDNEVIEEEVKGYIDVVRKGNETIPDEQIQRLNEIQDTMGGLIDTLRKVSGTGEVEAVQEETIVETESELDSMQKDTVQKLEEILTLYKSFTQNLDNGNFTQREVDEVLRSKEMLSNLIDMFVAGSKAIDYVLKLKKDLEKADADEYVLGCDFAGFFDLLCSSLETGLGNTGLDTDSTGGSDQADRNELLKEAKEALDAVMAGLENAIEDGIVDKLRRQIEDQEDEQKRGHPAPKRLSGIRDSLKRLSRSFKKGASQR